MRARPALLGRVGQAIERDAVRERIARAVHDTYRSAAVASASAWDDLSEQQRSTSRAFAEALPLMLVRAGYRITAVAGSVPREFADASTTELLAAQAHTVWAGARVDDGWVWGAVRSDGGREHPDIVAWVDLADDRREIDRVLVRAIPPILAEAGRGLTLITPPLISVAPGRPSDRAETVSDPAALVTAEAEPTDHA